MTDALRVAVVGPTAAGKSALAVSLAQALNAEVVNADSMALYRGMDIGTAKPTSDQRAAVPHHLIDVLDPDEPSTVAEFQLWARAAIEDCHQRGRGAVLVGGSALYMRAVLDKFEFPGTDPALRERLEQQERQLGTAALHARLAELDPQSASVLDPANGRRIVRALEVIELTGRPYQASLPPHEYAHQGTVQIGVDVPRPILEQRINDRVRAMFDAGLVTEVAALETQLRAGRTAGRALGYSQVLSYLAGEYSIEQAQELTAQATRRFARRQDSWFRKDARVHWLRFDAPDLIERSVSIIAASHASHLDDSERMPS